MSNTAFDTHIGIVRVLPDEYMIQFQEIRKAVYKAYGIK